MVNKSVLTKEEIIRFARWISQEPPPKLYPTDEEEYDIEGVARETQPAK